MPASSFMGQGGSSGACAARAARDHLAGVRRGVLFLSALGFAVLLFVDAGRHASAGIEAAPSEATNLCAGYAIPCAPTP